MLDNFRQTPIFHITDLANLAGIIKDGGLYSDAIMAKRHPEPIGYDHIKRRRLKRIPVPCAGWRFVGEFVPFYFCPRSPMLFAINKGRTGRAEGCQRTILHLVSNLGAGIDTGKEWAVSSGNAGAFHTTFESNLDALDSLDWEAIEASQWEGLQHQKSAEFLVVDFFPWTAVNLIGCQNSVVADKVRSLVVDVPHKPAVEIKTSWYY